MSINFEKCNVNTNRLYAICKHNSRECKTYDNKHINIMHSNKNEQLYNLNAHEVLDKVKARVQDVDSIQKPKRLKRDRVTAVAICIPLPVSIENTSVKADQFFNLIKD